MELAGTNKTYLTSPSKPVTSVDMPQSYFTNIIPREECLSLNRSAGLRERGWRSEAPVMVYMWSSQKQPSQAPQSLKWESVQSKTDLGRLFSKPCVAKVLAVLDKRKVDI